MKWSKERAWEWYNSRPWIRGCNYMSADCANRIDQWQAYGFEERLETTENELALMAELGYNSVRLILEFIVWDEEHDSFMERFERYISLCDKYGISCMIVDANDLGQEILGHSDDIKLSEEELKGLIKDNPSGQGKELTPLILIRKK